MGDGIVATAREIDAERRMQRTRVRASRGMCIVLSLLVLIVLGLNALVLRAALAPPETRTVYTSNAAAVCAFSPVDEPGAVSAATVREFASRAATDLHTLDYANWRKTLDRVTAETFTPRARRDVVDGLARSRVLPTIVAENYISKPIVGDAVTIAQEGIREGVYQWTVEVPLLLVYIGSEGGPAMLRPESRTLIMTVVRAPVTADNPKGLKVDQMYSSQTLDTSPFEHLLRPDETASTRSTAEDAGEGGEG